MPIILPQGLPAADRLRQEGLAVLTRDEANREPLQIALVNLMPDRPTTETQFARLLAGTEHPVELTLAIPNSHNPKTTPHDYLATFYRRWTEIAARRFDGLIVTGAPVEHLPFEEVHYWPELCRIFDWARAAIPGSYHVCWAAQAALRHFHGVRKHALPQKAFGVFPQRTILRSSPLMRGLGETFPTPVSRHTEIRCAELPWSSGLLPLSASPRSGLCLLEDRPNRTLCMFNHLEYDADTLQREYLRDRAAGLNVPVPVGYFPADAPDRVPQNTWRPAARILFANWLDRIASETRTARVAGSTTALRGAQRFGVSRPSMGFGF